MKEKPLILVVNDDGYEAKGLWALVKAAAPFGELVIISPDSHRSGMGHAITMNSPLRIHQHTTPDGIAYYRTNGTPVDCVKLALQVILKNRKVDLLLSGINHGSNASANLIYSGTMGAAIEGSFANIPSMGISLLDYSPNADFEAATEVSSMIIQKVLATPIPNHTSLNVNIPKLPLSEIKGIKVVRQTFGAWHEDFEERKDVYGNPYYWMAGELIIEDQGEDNCQWALAHQYVSVQPVQFDMTAYKHINTLKFLEQ